MPTPTTFTAVDKGGLLALASDLFWRQDADDRFVVIEGRAVDSGALDVAGWLGQTAQQIGLGALGANQWPTQAATTPLIDTIRDRIVCWLCGDGSMRYLRISAERLHDATGGMRGWHGLAIDVTEAHQCHGEFSELRAAVDASPDMIFVTDCETLRFVYVNDIACELTGYDRGALLALPPHELLMIDREQLRREVDTATTSGGTTREIRTRTRSGNSSIAEERTRAVVVRGRWLIVSAVTDISQRKRAEWARDRLSRFYASLSGTNEAILRATTPADLFAQVCEAAVVSEDIHMTTILLWEASRGDLEVRAVAGVSIERIRALALSAQADVPGGGGLVGRCFRSGRAYTSDDHELDSRTEPWHEVARSTGVKSCAAVPIVKAGQIIGAMLIAAKRRRAFDRDSVVLLERMAGNVAFALENMEHEAQRREGEKHIEFMATHDALTQLPNRALLNQSLKIAIESARRHGRRFALLFLDLDRFKTINDSLGHDAGDELLQVIGERLRQCVRASDLVSRIGGDEFVLLLNEVDNNDDVGRFADKLLTRILEPLILNGHEHRMSTSIGVAFYPEDADDGDHLMKHADMAMYRAKELGKNNVQFYDAGIRTLSLQRIELEQNLRQALEHQNFDLAYQAKISLADERIIGVEALLRWHSPALGDLEPSQFLPLAEEIGLIIPIGRWVLETACAQNMAWQRQGLPAVRMAVNLSPAQLGDHQLVAHLESVLARTGMPAELLELEITETAVMEDIDEALALLARIKRLGVFISIDDFGIGYSSLAQLRHLPVDSLKIDRSFISALSSNTTDQSIAQAIITMGKSLSLNVIAEGVETAEQQAFLRAIACDDMQGFYFSRPDSKAGFADLLRSHQPGATD